MENCLRLKGWVANMGKFRLKIEGLNINRLLNVFNAKNIEIYDLKKLDYNNLELTIDSYNFKYAKNLIKNNGLNVRVIGGSGFTYFLKANWFRFGVVVGLAFSFVAFIIATSFYWNVEVEIDTENSEVVAKVQEFLSQQGIVVGEKVKKLKSRELERIILECVDDASLVVVEQKGVSLKVFIKESTKPLNLSEKGVVASYSGVIEEIKLASGQLMVNIGDAVTKGDVLIASGKIGDVFMEAHGSIVARVQIEGDSVGSTEQTSMVRSGNFVEVVYLDAFGKRFYSSDLTEDMAEKQYIEYELERQEVVLTQNNLLPIKKIVLRYYEIQESCVTIEYEQLIEQLSATAYNIAESRLPDGAEALAVGYNVVQDGSLYKVICSIETRIDIAKRAEN